VSIYDGDDDDGDGVEEAPEVATPPEGAGDAETARDAEETDGDAEDFDAEAAAAEAVEGAEADDGEEGDDGGGGLLATVLAIGLLVFGILLGGDQQQRPGGV